MSNRYSVLSQTFFLFRNLHRGMGGQSVGLAVRIRVHQHLMPLNQVTRAHVARRMWPKAEVPPAYTAGNGNIHTPQVAVVAGVLSRMEVIQAELSWIPEVVVLWGPVADLLVRS